MRDALAAFEVRTALMSTTIGADGEPSSPVATALRACDAFVLVTERSLSHSQARVAASSAGARGAGIGAVSDPGMLERLLSIDLDRVAGRSRGVAERLTEATIARVTCPAGTDLRLRLDGRGGLADAGDLRTPGSYGNLPFGEGYISPVTADGHICPSTVAGIGILDDGCRLQVLAGALVDADGAPGLALMERLRPHGRPGRNLAELGLGTNDGARLTGHVLEDEKLLGSAHVAFGSSAGIGGSIDAGVHIDCVITRPTVTLDDDVVVQDGMLVLEVPT
jgi:leucyl aminopeptidase (aminopeptidase T)